MAHDILQMIAQTHSDAGDLVVLVGHELLNWAKGSLYKAQGETPTEKERIESATVTETYGSLPAYKFGAFPARGEI